MEDLKMAQGKILIVNKLNGSVLGWFGETSDDSRPVITDISLVELESGQYADDFINLKRGMAGVKVLDIENKTLTFDTTPLPTPPTYEELQQQLALVQQQLLQEQGAI